MSYSDSYPNVSPTWQCNFSANGGRIDPRATFSRSDTPPTYAAPSAVHYWSNEKHLSSENLLKGSQSFDNASYWNSGNNQSNTGGATAPDGSSTAITLSENSATDYRIYDQPLSLGADTYTLTVYAKRGSGTRYLYVRLYSAFQNWSNLVFDLAGGAVTTANGSATSFSGISGTQAQVGSYYKITATFTAVALNGVLFGMTTSSPVFSTSYGIDSYAGDGSSSIILWGAQLNTTGATVYDSPTTTQIARSYASSLKSVSYAGQPRFEYSTDGESAGTSLGILIEGQSTNLLTYSSDMSNAAWTKGYVSASAEAIGPDGQLSAFAIRELGGLQYRNITQVITTGSGSVAFSVYAKLMGNARRLIIREDAATGNAAVFDLNTGTVVTATGGVTATHMAPASNGWYRCTMVSTPGAGARLFALHLATSTATTIEQYTGDSYSGLLLAMPQAEDQSFASSWISTTTATATRAADSLSMALSDISGYSDGSGTVAYEATVLTTSALNQTGFEIGGDTGSDFIKAGYGVGGTSGAVTCYVVKDSSSQAFLNSGSQGVGSYKAAVRYEANNVGVSLNGAAAVTDTSATMPIGNTKLMIGSRNSNNATYLNGHVKRIALYGEALSDTNLQALTS